LETNKNLKKIRVGHLHEFFYADLEKKLLRFKNKL